MIYFSKKNIEKLTIEEYFTLRVFSNLLEEISMSWAYALFESPRQWVKCFYKKDNEWRIYIIQDGVRCELEYANESLYFLCLEIFKSIAGTDRYLHQYLRNAFIREAPEPKEVDFKKRY